MADFLTRDKSILCMRLRTATVEYADFLLEDLRHATGADSPQQYEDNLIEVLQGKTVLPLVLSLSVVYQYNPSLGTFCKLPLL